MMNQQFYQVLRVFFKGDDIARSTEFFNEYSDAEKRYYAIIASDIANNQITYHGAYIIDAYGNMMEFKVFDRRDFSEPEPEIEQEEPGEGEEE